MSDTQVLSMLRIGCGAVVACYGLGLWYKSGLGRDLVSDKVNAKIDALAALTQPPAGTSKKFAFAAKHMIGVFAHTLGAFAVSGAGTLLFYAIPKLPMPLTLTMTAVGAATLHFTRPEDMSTVGRLGALALSALSTGYIFGPLNWVTSATPFFAIAGSVMASASACAVLCRGPVSYFVNSQLLSNALGTLCALSVINPTAPGQLNTWLCVQGVASLGLAACYSMPVLASFCRLPDGTTEKELIEVAQQRDTVKEAAKLFGASAYICFRTVRQISSVVVHRVTREESFRGMTKEERSRVRQFAGMAVNAALASDVVAGLVCLALYVKVVATLQGGDAVRNLNSLKAALRC